MEIITELQQALKKNTVLFFEDKFRSCVISGIPVVSQRGEVSIVLTINRVIFKMEFLRQF
jgi:hypothetical protein